MIEKVIRFSTQYHMLEKGDTVVCGLSGGADSVCLLLVLLELSKTIEFNIEALHVNHCLRGTESDRDEKFCMELCSNLGIPFKAVSCDVTGYAEKNSLTTEEAARKLRYQIFSENSVNKKIATAHNANDNLETVIFNLARGTALKGLTGIPPVRDNIIRPLLSVSRKEIEEYLTEKKQSFITDSTNLTDDYTRNKIRHLVLPVLAEINHSVIETSVNTIDALREENRFIEKQTECVFKENKNGNTLINLSDYDNVVRKRCISRILVENSIPYSYKRLSELDETALHGGKVNLSGDFYAVSDGNSFEVKRISRKKDIQIVSSELRIGTNSIFDGKTVNCELIKCDNQKKNTFIHKKLTYYYLDYDKIKGRAVIRSRKFGDKIKLKGRNFTSSVKKLINSEIPDSEREYLHFIEDDCGTIFAEKLGIADRVAPDENTVNLLKITIE